MFVVCSTTIWVGHLAKTVMKENLMEMFEANQLAVSSIDVCIEGLTTVHISKFLRECCQDSIADEMC